MLRLDEDLGEFYALCEAMQEWGLNVRTGGGRLLRCPTFFEDVVYTLCTTNTTWAGTIRMVERLVAVLGEEFPGQKSCQAFPTVMAIATAGEEVLRYEVRLGYRGRYLWQLALAVAEGRLDLASLEAPDISIRELRQALLRIKGIGSYATATLLMLLGRYEELAIDSQMRAFVARKYFRGQPVTLAQIRQTYAPWGRWQYLAYWFDP